jgi:lipoate-protein ligase B
MKILSSDIGLVEYGKALELQKRLVASIVENKDTNILLLLEHPHVITLGRSTSKDNFRNQPIPVFQVERGGDATYHGPGQLVGYTIFHLNDHDVRRFVNNIEEAIIRSVSHFGINAERKEGHRGVWVRNGELLRKLASIGVAVDRWITYHGFALNVNTDLSYFKLINPCGLPPEALTSMEKILGRKVGMEQVKRYVAEEFASVFNAEVNMLDPESIIERPEMI